MLIATLTFFRLQNCTTEKFLQIQKPSTVVVPKWPVCIYWEEESTKRINQLINQSVSDSRGFGVFKLLMVEE